MHDLELVAELRVVVRQRIHAVRTLREDFSHAVLLQRRVVFLGQFLKQKLVAEPPGRVAGATFVRAKHGEVHAGLDQQLGDGAGDLLRATIERSGATDPPQDFEIGMVAGQRHVESVRPRQALGLRESPRVALGLHLAHRVRGGSGQRTLGGAVAAQLKQQAKRIDPHRAGSHAGIARSARPDRLGFNCVSVQRDRSAVGGHLHQPLQVLHDRLGRERLAGGERRTRLLATTALHAGVETQQLLLVEVRDLRDADHAGFLDVLDGNWRQLAKRRRGKKQVRRAGDEMEQPSERNHREETKHHQRVHPPNSQVRRAAGRLAHLAEELGQAGADRRTPQRQPFRPIPDNAQPLDEVARDADAEKQAEHRPVARTMPDAAWPPHPTPREQTDAEDEQQAKHIERPLVNHVIPAMMKMKFFGYLGRKVIDLQQRRAEKQHHEPGEHHDVRPTGQATATHPFLSEALLQQSTEARLQSRKIAEQDFPDGDRPALPPKFPAPPNAPAKHQQRRRGYHVKSNDRRRRNIAERLSRQLNRRFVHHIFTRSDFGS